MFVKIFHPVVIEIFPSGPNDGLSAWHCRKHPVRTHFVTHFFLEGTRGFGAKCQRQAEVVLRDGLMGFTDCNRNAGYCWFSSYKILHVIIKHPVF